MDTPAHQGIKAQRLQWIGNSGKIITMGSDDFNERQYAVFDTRDISKPLTLKKLDNEKLTSTMYYDDSINTVYVCNKGANFTQFFYYHSGDSTLQLIDKYSGKESQLGMTFMPKRNVDFMANELNRAVRLTKTTAEYISFKVPRRSGMFQPDLYPPAPASQFAMACEDYCQGVNKAPILAEFDPTQVSVSSNVAKR